jgi:hypothetical protein
MAEPTPRGRATNMEPKLKRNVPTMQGMIPPSVIIFLGASVKNSHEMAEMPLENRKYVIIPKASALIKAAHLKRPKETACVIFF